VEWVIQGPEFGSQLTKKAGDRMKTFMNLVVSLLWLSAMALQGFAQEASGVGIALGKKGERYTTFA
jgi:hypothetical protein